MESNERDRSGKREKERKVTVPRKGQSDGREDEEKREESWDYE